MANTRVTNPVTDFDKSTSLPGLKLPSGTNANQPSGVQGMIRNDTGETTGSSASAIEHHNGTNWQYFAATESPDVVYPTDLKMYLDASNTTSYPGTGTTWFDLTTNNTDGTITGPQWDPSGYFDFDGSNDYVDLSGYGLNSSCKSFSIWFNADSWTGMPLQIGDDQGVESFLFLYNGNLDVRLGNSQARYTGFNTTGSWIHVVATPDSSNRTQLYVNGSLINTSTTTIQAVTQNTAFLGKRDSNNWYFNGKISKTRIYDVTLTQAEITALYNEGR